MGTILLEVLLVTLMIVASVYANILVDKFKQIPKRLGSFMRLGSVVLFIYAFYLYFGFLIDAKNHLP